MKALLSFAILLLAGLGLHAQHVPLEVITSAGSSSSMPNTQLTWTLGEMSIATFSSPQVTLTQGFNQADLVVTAVEDDFPEMWEVTAFPNPVSEVLRVRWSETTQPVHLRFTNLSGQLVYETKVENTAETQFQVTDYPQGTYILEVFDPSGVKGKTFKVEVIRH